MVGRRALITPNPKLKVLERMREVLALQHYSIRTKTSYCDWILRYIKFHGMRSREELLPAEPKMELFLSDLAVNGKVAAAGLENHLLAVPGLQRHRRIPLALPHA